MTAQVKTWAAPGLEESENGVLHVGKLKEDAHGVVPPNQQAAAGDTITMHVKTSTGNKWDKSRLLTAAEVGKPVIYKIPKAVFEEGLVTDASADLDYRITKNGGAPQQSPTLRVKLVR
ncbi:MULTISPECIES: hypothetical protein [unclassified Pseudomonas]|jgi:hypothetical protein|uniref:hypothetical protein n=1 Tax=unclassified Pseudomonas TaxID=196821 RepID=UPI000C88B556|nr:MULTISPECIES: hypothetical protein [unclassified Pseudomonas]PNA05003.1 hypothetical protein C1X28_12075 [Pseudomonas sp. FW305-BF15]PNB81229.1 hypothetical protein C1X30_07660 [Pseudomonas sp. FW305-BF6]